MPKEHKKRGRREEKKRKREEDPGHSPLKRQKPEEAVEGDDDSNQANFVTEGDVGDDFIGFHEKADPMEAVFYGLLDEEEQNYYTSVNAKLEANDFEDEDDRSAFVDAVYRESSGKELKIACSQSCSRYLERLILVSSPDQLRSLFAKFQTHFLHLIQHRFASHCCEALFLQSAKYVNESSKQSIDAEAETQTFENLFLETVKELSDNLGYLLTERFASHSIRILILVLSGEQIDQVSTSTVVASRKKEKIEILSTAEPKGNDQSTKRNVPSTFTAALKTMIGKATSSLNTTYIRALATHPTGNPVLQLLLRLELTGTADLNAKDTGSLFRRLFPEDSFEDGTESAKFAQGLLYDPSGSRLLETIVQAASGKTFKKMYRALWKENMPSMAKNDTASYVAIQIMRRVGKDEISSILDQLLAEIPTLVERNRLTVIRTLIERCQFREVELHPLFVALKDAYGLDASARLAKMLRLDEALTDEESAQHGKHSSPRAVDLHGSLLAQTILQTPSLNGLLHESLLATSPGLIFLLCKDPSASRVIQAALQPAPASVSFRRQFIPLLEDHIIGLATDVSGSHVIDALWDGTVDLHFMKERIARTLQAHEGELRESRYGRVVWRNWSMDLFQRRKAEWQALAKDSPGQQESTQNGPTKSGIELARARFAAKQANSNRPKSRPSTVSANA